jgi:hypothetical protein
MFSWSAIPVEVGQLDRQARLKYTLEYPFFALSFLWKASSKWASDIWASDIVTFFVDFRSGSPSRCFLQPKVCPLSDLTSARSTLIGSFDYISPALSPLPTSDHLLKIEGKSGNISRNIYNIPIDYT